MHKLFILSLVCCFSLLTQAQVSNRLGLALYNKLQKPEYAHSAKLTPLLVKGNPGLIQGLVSQYHGVYKFAAGDISSVAIPYKNLIAFSQQPGIIRLESPNAKGMAFMDSARIYNNVDSAQQGIAPLTQPYNGSGVIVGVIDGGIYFRHQDFRRANGNTRVLYLWDQLVSTAASPAGYAYGSEWDSTAINAGLCTEQEPLSDNGHGTNVAGVAAGNGSSFANSDTLILRNRYTGVAPNADMIIVKLNDTSTDFLQTVVDGVSYIFNKATELGRPCVINISQGTYYGSHDGQDLSTQAIEALLDAQDGRVLVASAGNAGGYKFHLSYPLSSTDSLFTWFSYNATYHQVYFDLWADTAGFNLQNFAIGCDNSTAAAYLGRTPYYNLDSFPGLAQGVTVQTNVDTIYQGATMLGLYQIAVTLSGGTYHMEFFVSPVTTSNIWRLQTIGQGKFDLWDFSSAIAGSSNPLPAPTTGTPAPLPGGFTSPNYRYPDSLESIVSSFQCSDKVITVANYSNRYNYLDGDSAYIYQTAGILDGSLIPNSSIGPTRDGRIKPDIAATGDVTTATGDSLFIATLISAGNGVKVSYGGKHNRNGGTSMASPIVAGTAALYMQKHPHAGWSEVKQALELTAKKDTFTTYNIPNIKFGWGKVNAYQALLLPVVYGCKDTGSFNYNASANIDTGGCVAKVYGCIDTGSINYDSTANTSNGSCITKVYGVMDTLCSNYNALANVSSGACVPLGIKEAIDNNISFDVVPNPFNNTATIIINTTTPLVNASVRFYDILGKQADAISIPAGATQVTYTNTKLAAGIYNATIVSDGKIVATKKVVAE